MPDVGLAQNTLAEVLARLAAREPAPGGGSGAALTGAIAAALTEMAASFAPGGVGRGEGGAETGEGGAGGAETGEGGGGGVGSGPAHELRDRAHDLRRRLLELADDDTRSYAPVLEVLALDRADPSRAERLSAALAAAAAVPMAIAEAAAEVGELAALAGRVGSPHLLGDATAAAVLAEAATQAAVALVGLNLERSPGDPRLHRARELAHRAAAAKAAVLG